MPEPVDLADIKRHLVLDPDDATEDAYLTSMIVAARRSCELRTRRTIVGEERDLVLAAFPPSEPVMLGWLVPSSPASPVSGQSDLELTGGSVAGATVRYFDAAGDDITLAPTAYYIALGRMPAVLTPKTTWPSTQQRPDAVRIEYTLSPLEGGDLDMVRHAIRLIVGHWYANREAVSPDSRAGTNELPIAVSWLLDPLTAFARD